jgi:hypothetical protein
LTIWKCVHTMNLNIVKYLSIIWMYVNIIMWIWIMYKFKFEIFNYNLNMYLLNGVCWRKVADTIDLSLVLAGFCQPSPKILWHTPSRGFFCIDCVITADTKDRSLILIDSSWHKKGSFFISYKGYRIRWPTPKIVYQHVL